MKICSKCKSVEVVRSGYCPSCFRDYYTKYRVMVINHYSQGEMRCQSPTCEVQGGAKDIRCLSLDHIKGGGANHRASIKGGNFGVYRWIVSNNFPSGFQVLCMNCQFIKRYDNNEITGARKSNVLPAIGAPTLVRVPPRRSRSVPLLGLE